jgi:iron complex outermembrane receptor protein
MCRSLPPTKITPLLFAISAAIALPLAAQTLEEVVVSASRSEQRSFDAPAALHSVARDTIQSAGPQVNLSESLSRVPGLTILDRQNYAQDLQLSIRGFGARSAFGIRGIRLLIDGIPASTPDGQSQGSSISLPSTERIEVLRGPMALLYGNSSGGVIQAFTMPAPAEPALDYQYYVGSYGLHRAGYQFGDTLGTVGIVAHYSTMTIDGYRANSAAERQQFNGKITLAPSEDLTVNVVFNQFDMPLAQDPLGLTRTQLQMDPSGAGANAMAAMTRKVVLQNQIGTSATYTLSTNQSLTWRGYYGTRENTQYLASNNWIGLNRAYYGVGLQYNARSVWWNMPVQWVAGYEFDRSREYRQSGAAVQGQKSGSLSRSEDNQSESSDLFAQGSAFLSERWSLAAGLRSSTVRFISPPCQNDLHHLPLTI